MPKIKFRPTDVGIPQIAAVIFVAVILLALYLSWVFSSWNVVNGLTGEAGIIKQNGEIIPLKIKTSTFDIFTVNSIDVEEGDYLYWRFWLNVKAAGIEGQLKSVRFNLWQKVNGVAVDWKAGTEGVTGSIPHTSPNEDWFQVTLPVDVVVDVTLKYRDDFCGAESASNLFPFTELSGDGTHVIRDRRMEVCLPSHWVEGTTVLKVYCDVIEIVWQWQERGQTKTGSIVPDPSSISYTFTVTKTSAGLTATLTDSASH